MKDEVFTGLICKEFCSYYKEGREEMACETYNFLTRNLTEGELRNLTRGMARSPDLSSDDYIKEAICSRCDFLKEGCDFRAGAGSPPCGGYVIIENLRRL